MNKVYIQGDGVGDPDGLSKYVVVDSVQDLRKIAPPERLHSPGLPFWVFMVV